MGKPSFVATTITGKKALVLFAFEGGLPCKADTFVEEFTGFRDTLGGAEEAEMSGPEGMGKIVLSLPVYSEDLLRRLYVAILFHAGHFGPLSDEDIVIATETLEDARENRRWLR